MKINFKNKERNTGFMAVKRYVGSDGIEELVGNTDDYIFSYQADNMSKKTFLFKNNHHSYQTEEEIRLICKIVGLIAKLREDRVRVRNHSSLFSPISKGEIMSKVN